MVINVPTKVHQVFSERASEQTSEPEAIQESSMCLQRPNEIDANNRVKRRKHVLIMVPIKRENKKTGCPLINLLDTKIISLRQRIWFPTQRLS